MSDVSLSFTTTGRDRGVNALLTRTANNVRAANLASAASSVALGAAWASASSYAIALASSAMTAAGAVAAVPAALATGAAIMIASKAATFGLSEAWKATGQDAVSGAGKAVTAANRVAAAENQVTTATRALASAKRDEKEATDAVNRARSDEIERLSDLSRTLAGARLDEEAATRAVEKAAADLAQARTTGNIDTIKDADLAYRQSQQTLLEVKDRVQDLGAEQADGARKGVEGSDAVQQALRRQGDAHQQTVEAAERLAAAQKAVGTSAAAATGGGINPAQKALAKLAPNARDTVLQMRALVPAWEGAARVGQQKTFAGVAGDLRVLSATYLPGTTAWLGRMGGSFNTAIRQTLGLATTKDTVRDVGIFTGNTALAADRLAQAVRPVTNGFLQWVTVGSSFIPGLAGDSLSIAQRFERWSVAMRTSGQASTWIGNGVIALRKMWQAARDVAMSVVAIVRAGSDGGAGGGVLDFLVRGAAAMRRWTESAQGQQKIGQVLAGLRGILGAVGGLLAGVAGHGQEFNDALNVTGTVVHFAAGHLGALAKWLPLIAAGFVISKVATVGANAAKVASIPIMVGQLVVNRQLTAALRQHTLALGTATGAQNAENGAQNRGILARGRAVISTVAQRVATVASTIATRAAAAGQWLLNAAMNANPIMIVVGLLILLGVGFYLLWTKSATFRKIVTGAFQAVGHAATVAKDWIIEKFEGLITWITGLPGKIGKATAGMWDGLKTAFKSALNWLIGKWNGFGLTIPGFSIAGISIPGFSLNTPDIPLLAQGGIVPATPGGRLAVLGEGGEDEAVMPLSKLGSLGGGTTRHVVELRLNGRLIRELLLDEAKLTGKTPAQLFA